MSTIRNYIESGFEKLGQKLYQNCYLVLIVSFLCITALICQIPNITIDTATSAMIRADDPIRVEYDFFKDDFGREDLIFILIESSHIFEEKFLKTLKSFHQDLEESVPYLKTVVSLINARHVFGKGDDLFIEDLLKDWPEKPVDFSFLKHRVMGHPLYVNNIISEDGRFTAIVLEREVYVKYAHEADELLSEFDDTDPKAALDIPNYFSDEQNSAFIAAVQKVVDRYRSENFSIAIAGGPLLFDALNRAVIKDLVRSVMLGLGIMVFFQAILFRNVSGVVLPAIIVFSSMLSTIGIMAIYGVTIKITTTMLPAFLVAVGVGDSIHILAIFYRRLHGGAEKKDAVIFSLGHSGFAVLMTTLTTAAGFLSFSFADLTVISDIGIFAAIGVGMAFIFTIFMLPALLAVTPIKPDRSVKTKQHVYVMDRVLLFFAKFSVSHPWRILITTMLVMVISVFFIFKIEFSQDMMNWFPDNMVIKKDLLLIDQELKGTVTLEVVVDTNKENGVYEPDILNRIEALSKNIRQIKTPEIYVGKVFSINDIIKEINQALHDNDSTFYTIPQNRQLIAQQMLLFENSGSDDLERIVDSQFQKTRFSIKTTNTDAVIFVDFIEDITTRFKKAFDGLADITVTGIVSIAARIVSAAINSMVRSYVVAFVVISLMMILLTGNIKIGLLSMIPNLLPIVMVIGIMGGCGIPLDMVSLMIGSIAIGLAVDDTVHFIYNFLKYVDRTNDSHEALRQTFLSTGRAMLITTLVLSSGFFVVMFSTLIVMKGFGFFTGLCILLALLSDFVTAPAIMVLVTKSRQKAEN